MAPGLEAEYRDVGARAAWPAEFEKIRETCSKYDYTYDEAKKPENNIYNRYRDICPFDHSRIILKKGHNDYINANIVKVEKANKQYILTQGPMTGTISHFWRMVWEQNCKAIIMLNKRIENDKIKCSMYWPGNIGSEHEMKFPNVGLTVEQLTDDFHVNYSTRIIKITDTETNTSRQVIQFHYVTWPDFGIPSSPTAFLDFLYKVRASGAMDPEHGPAVVHCSAGVGRSGTFCLVDSCLVLIKNFGPESVNVREVLLEMRKYRMGLIQTPDQLRFSYQAIIQGAQQLDEDHSATTNGNDELSTNGIAEESHYDTVNESVNDAPPVPPPRAASLKINTKNLGDNQSEENEASDSDICDEPVINGTESCKNDYNPPTKALPAVPTDSDDEIEESSIHENDKDFSDRKLPDIPVSENMAEIIETSEPPYATLRRRQIANQKAENLQDRIQDMKRKQQKAEQWQNKKRSIYIPMTITLGILTCGALAYFYFKN